MGLDQYIEIRHQEDQPTWVEYQYYRKFNELQGWFERNYQLENCGRVSMSISVIDSLVDDIKEDRLVPTAGFFYGDRPATPERYAGLLEVLKDAKEIMESDPKTEFSYTCWY